MVGGWCGGGVEKLRLKLISAKVEVEVKLGNIPLFTAGVVKKWNFPLSWLGGSLMTWFSIKQAQICAEGCKEEHITRI